MRICRFTTTTVSMPRLGIIAGQSVLPLADGETIESFPTPRTVEAVAISEVKLLAPAAPSKIVCVGRNYREHAAELGNKMPDQPLLFLKAPSSVVGSGDCIELPPQSQQVEHEGELGVVIGRRARKLSSNDDPLNYILGLTCVNDVTARDLQRKDVQFTRGKGFDTFGPIGPCIAVGLEGRDLQIRGYVNGDLRQDSRTREMVFTIPELVEYISAVMTLVPGDIIATGTPAGVGPIRPGDSVTVHLEGVGALTNPVVARE